MAAMLCLGMLQVTTGRGLSLAAFVAAAAAAAAGVAEVEQAGVLCVLVTLTVRTRLLFRYTSS
jgi:hypothetical protein